MITVGQKIATADGMTYEVVWMNHLWVLVVNPRRKERAMPYVWPLGDAEFIIKNVNQGAP